MNFNIYWKCVTTTIFTLIPSSELILLKLASTRTRCVMCAIPSNRVSSLKLTTKCFSLDKVVMPFRRLRPLPCKFNTYKLLVKTNEGSIHKNITVIWLIQIAPPIFNRSSSEREMILGFCRICGSIERTSTSTAHSSWYELYSCLLLRTIQSDPVTL